MHSRRIGRCLGREKPLACARLREVRNQAGTYRYSYEHSSEASFVTEEQCDVVRRDDWSELCPGACVSVAALALLCATAAWTQVTAGPRRPSQAHFPVYPLKVSANRRYLVDRNNIPFLIAGDVPQPIVAKISTADAAVYFDNRQAHGFNAMWINVLSAGPYYYYSPDDGSTYDGIRPFTDYVPGGRDVAHYDLAKPNEAYFTRVDQMLTLAAKRGMVVFLNPIETGGWLSTLRNNGNAAAYAYGMYLGNRYKRFANIIWLNGNDFNSWKNPVDDDVVTTVAAGIKSADPIHLQTVELNVETSSSFDDPAWIPIISLNSTYTYAPTYLQMWHSYNQTPIGPTYFVEGHYDLSVDLGHPKDFGTPLVLRRQEYWAMLSGGKGQLYGNGYTCYFMPGWKYFVDTAGVTQFMIWHAFFSTLSWQDLVPDQDHTVVTGGLGNPGDLETRVSMSDFATASRTQDRAVVVVYMPTAREITVNMASLKAPATAKWFDPTNGTYRAIQGEPFINSGSRQFMPPGNNHDGDSDWVLELDASGSNH
jgi:hypothetical protein